MRERRTVSAHDHHSRRKCHHLARPRRLRIIGKGGHERRVPIGDDLAAEVLARDTEYVFPSVDYWGNALGPHLTPHHLGKLMSDALPVKRTAHTDDSRRRAAEAARSKATE
jgi:integrase/recombinase XerD